jgi:hypothetical protein
MPVLQIGGNRVFVSDDEADSRLAALSARERHGRLGTLDAEELQALRAYAERSAGLRAGFERHLSGGYRLGEQARDPGYRDPGDTPMRRSRPVSTPG